MPSTYLDLYGSLSFNLMIQPLKVITDPFIQNTPSNLIAMDRQFEPLNATVNQIEK